MDRRVFITGAATTAAAAALPTLPGVAATPPVFELTSKAFEQGQFLLVQFSEDEISNMLSQLAARAAQDGINVLVMPSPVHIHDGVVLEAISRAYEKEQPITEVFNQLPAGTKHLHIRSFYKASFMNEASFQPDHQLIIRYAFS